MMEALFKACARPWVPPPAPQVEKNQKTAVKKLETNKLQVSRTNGTPQGLLGTDNPDLTIISRPRLYTKCSTLSLQLMGDFSPHP